MPVRTGAVDSHYLIRSMKTSIRFAMITSTATSFSQNYFDGQVLVGEKEFLVQMNNGGSVRVRHLRDGLILEGPIDAPAVDIPWN
jgi:hypothetical protein